MATVAELLKEIDEAKPSSVKSDTRPNFYLESAKRGLSGLAALPSAVGEAVAPLPIKILRDALFPSLANPATTVRSAVDRLTGSDPSMQPQGAAEKYGGKAIEFAVAGAPFSVLNIARAGMKLPSIMSEIGSILGGSTAANVGGDIGERYGARGTGEALGGLLGGVAGGMSPVLASKAIGVGRQITPKSLDDVANQAGTETVRNALLSTHGAADELTKSMEVAGQIPGFRPTLSQASGARAVGDIERNLASKNPDVHGEAISRQRQNVQALDEFSDQAFPAGKAPQLNRSVDRATREVDARLNQIDRARQQLTVDMPATSAKAMGEKIRPLFDEAFDKARGVKTAKYEDVYKAADDNKVAIQMDDVRDLVTKIKSADENAFADMPGTFGKVLRQYAGDDVVPKTGRSVDPEIVAHLEAQAAKPVSFRELHSLMKDASSAYYTARASGDLKAPQQAYFLGQLRDTLKQKVDAIKEGDGIVASKLRDADDFYVNQYRRAFRLGVGGELNATNRFGEKVLPEKVVSRFFTPSGMDDFYAVFGDDKKARQLLSDSVLGKAREYVVRNGKVSPTRLETFLRSNDDALTKLPEVRAALQSVDTVNDALVERALRLKDGKSKIDSSILAKLAKTDNIEQAAAEALSSKKNMMSLLSGSRSNEEQQAVVRAVVNAIHDAAGKAKVTPIDYVLANEAVLAPALNRIDPKHMQNLKLLASAQTIQGRADVPLHAQIPKEQTPIAKATGTTDQSMLSQFRAGFITRQQGQHYVVASLLAKYGLKVRGEAAEKVQRTLTENPALAAEMVKATRERVPIKDTGNRISDLLMSAGIRATATADDQ